MAVGGERHGWDGNKRRRLHGRPSMYALLSPLSCLLVFFLSDSQHPKRKIKAPSSLILFNLVSIFQRLMPHSLYPMISEE
jgi:hypothetical protein